MGKKRPSSGPGGLPPGLRGTVSIGEVSGIPQALFDDGERPMQLLSRWHGFALTFPGCEIFAET